MTWEGELPEDIESGIVYSVATEEFSAAWDASADALNETESWLAWEALWEENWRGEPLTAVVGRSGPNDYGTMVSSAYTGVSRRMEGTGPPYLYFAPYVMKGYDGLDTQLTIQNSGQECTSVWIDYMDWGKGISGIVHTQHIEQLAPGEAVQVKVPTVSDKLPCFWLGSAHIRAEVPLGIIVDETSFDEPCVGVDRGTLLTHRARPKMELRNVFGDIQVITDTVVYADLIFREWSGWDASIQVQNLSRTGQDTFVTVDFMDNSGDEILFLADWVCAGGSTTFYLPIVTDLGFEYVGSSGLFRSTTAKMG